MKPPSALNLASSFEDYCCVDFVETDVSSTV